MPKSCMIMMKIIIVIKFKLKFTKPKKVALSKNIHKKTKKNTKKRKKNTKKL